jgi:hypothetical protein
MAAPTTEEVERLSLKSDLTALCGWAGMDNALQDRWAGLLGFPGGKVGALHTRVVAALPADMYLEAMMSWKFGEQPASFYDKSLAMLVHSTAIKLGLPEVVAAVAKEGTVVDSKVEKKTVETRKVKVSNLVDSTDDTEVPAATPDQLKIWYGNYKALKHGEPLVEKEPSPDQVAAMHMRIITLGMEPYADFSLLTPYGRRVAKTLRHRSWVMQEDGSYRGMDVPGPESYEVWDACYKVYEVILLMLRFPAGEKEGDKETLVVTPFAIEAYHEAFAALSREHPECWHLCQKAEDRCRAEHFPRIARKLRESLNREPSWSEVFVAASEDDRYWDREVRRPALCYLARGKRGHEGHGAEPQEKRNKPNKPNSADKADKNDGKKGKSGGKGGGKSDQKHPKKDGVGRFTTTREGKPICFKFASDEKGTGCKEPCENHRMHVCQYCLQPHANRSCTKRT